MKKYLRWLIVVLMVSLWFGLSLDKVFADEKTEKSSQITLQENWIYTHGEKNSQWLQTILTIDSGTTRIRLRHDIFADRYQRTDLYLGQTVSPLLLMTRFDSKSRVWGGCQYNWKVGPEGTFIFKPMVGLNEQSANRLEFLQIWQPKENPIGLQGFLIMSEKQKSNFYVGPTVKMGDFNLWVGPDVCQPGYIFNLNFSKRF